jgi:LysM repeat protein
VGCPPEKDQKAARVDDLKKLFKLSSGASGTTHPAIYLLTPPPEKAAEKPGVTADEEKKLTIFEGSLTGKSGEESSAVPVKVVVQGKSEG